MILLLIVMIKNVIYLGSRYRHEGSSRKPKLSIKGICLNVKFTNIDLEKLDDFDKDSCYVKGNTEHQNPCWWCYTETCYSSHLYGFLAGTIIL